MGKASSSNRKKKKSSDEVEIPMTCFASLNEDLLHNILERLPALSFASAACVNKLLNRICNRILTRPRLASALSLDASSFQGAVEEVVNKILSEPIRPQFAIANVFGSSYAMESILHLFAKKLGSRIPIILSFAAGIMGRDVRTDEFKEVANGDDTGFTVTGTTFGISLTVGSLPGLKVKSIPLLPRKGRSRVPMVDEFVMDIRNFSASVSGATSPKAIIIFGNGDFDLKPTIEKLDYAISVESTIVGAERTHFLYRTGMEPRNFRAKLKFSSDAAIALVFAKDGYRPPGKGEIQFTASLSNGVSPIGPIYKASSVRVTGPDRETWLTARREGEPGILDGQRLLNDINDEIENHIECYDLCIGVTKRRKYSVGSEKSQMMTSLSLHGVIGGDDEYLYVHGCGIRTADYFQFYYSDPKAALSSCSNVSSDFHKLRLDWSSENLSHPTNSAGKKECLGGFIFSCLGRGESFFGQGNIDSAPFRENFPGVPLAGIFCDGEIGRVILNPNENESKGKSSSRCCLHVYSSVYLLISYAPPSPEP